MSVWRLLIPCVLPLIATALALAGVSANRAAGREPIELSEREAGLAPADADNTFRLLWLSWHSAPASAGTWFNREKLGSLGFDVSVDPSSPAADVHYARLLQRDAFAAFELDGPAWQALRGTLDADGRLRGREGRDDLLERTSRLVLVDVALDGETLAARYTNGRTHLVTAAVISAQRFAPDGEQPYVAGVVNNIAPNRIYVPRELAAALPAERPGAATTRFTVSVRYGSRFEPWAVAVTRK